MIARYGVGGPDWPPPYPDVPVEQLLADVKTYAASRGLPAELIDTLRIEAHRKGFAERLTFALVLRVLGIDTEPGEHTVTTTCSLDVPATWWQQWKAEHRGSRWWGWLARRRPVTTRTLTQPVRVTTRWSDTAVVFPHAAVQLAKVAGPYVFMATTTDDVMVGPWSVGPASREVRRG